MIKKISILVMFIMTVSLIACGGDKSSDSSASSYDGNYKEAYEALTMMVETQEAFLEDLDSVSDGKDLAEALNSFTDKMVKNMEMMNEATKKYPELNLKEDAPEEFAELEDRLTKASTEISTKMPQMMIKYSSNPDVLKAMQEMTTKMSDMNM